MTDDLRSLVQRCLRGDQAAMRDLVQQFWGQVFGLCYRMLGQRQDAEDVAQETFLRALRSLGNWDSARDFEPWLLAIAGNRCRTALSRRCRNSARPTPFAEADLPLGDWRHAASWNDDARAADLAEEVQLGLSLLREEYRQAFVLFHEREMPYGEIAQALAVPLGTIKTWVHRARKELIAHLRSRGVLTGVGAAFDGRAE